MISNFKAFLSKPEGFFLVTASTFGILFAILVPPFQTPDANVHFYRAYEVSELKIPHTIKNGESGSSLPLSIRQTEEAVHGTYGPSAPGRIMFNFTQKYSHHYGRSALSIPLNKNARIDYRTSSSPAYVPIMYAPQALVVTAGRLLNTPVILMVYGICFLNLIIWITLTFWGIKIFPWKKWAVVCICLLPVTVSQGISLGLDPMIFGASFIFIAVIFRAISSQKAIGNIDLALALIAGTIMIFGKLVLAVFLPLVLLAKNNQKANITDYVKKLSIIIMPIILYFIWVILANSSGSLTDQNQATTQLRALSEAPWRFVAALINTFFLSTPSGDILSQSVIGNFGWLDTPLTPPFVVFGYAAVTLILIANYEPLIKSRMISTRYRLVIALLGLIYFFGVFLAMYIYFTPVTGNHVRGVGGRYFVPLLFLMIPLLFTNLLRTKKSTYVRFVKFATVFLLAASTIILVLRYYINIIPE